MEAILYCNYHELEDDDPDVNMYLFVQPNDTYAHKVMNRTPKLLFVVQDTSTTPHQKNLIVSCLWELKNISNKEVGGK